MKLYDNNPQSKAMQSLIHDTRNEGDTIRHHGNKVRERMKELNISDTRLWVHLEYVTGRITEIEKAIDAYYEQFSKDFPETDEVPYKPQAPDAYSLTLKLLDKKEWDNEMMPTYKLLKKLMSGYTLIRNNNLDSEWLEETASPAVNILDAINESLSDLANEMNIRVDFSNKSYDGDKEAPFDQVGFIEHLKSIYPSPAVKK